MKNLLMLLVLTLCVCFDMQAYNPADLAKAQRFSKKQEDLRNADLSGANLSDLNLAGANLCNANLENAILFRTNLTGASLQDANCRMAYFDQADLSGLQIIRTNFIDAHFVQAKLIQSYAVSANFHDACMESALIQECVFEDCDMSLVKLTVDAKLGKVVFNACNLSDMVLRPNKVEATLMYRCHGGYSDIKDWMRAKDKKNNDLGDTDIERYCQYLEGILPYDLNPGY